MSVKRQKNRVTTTRMRGIAHLLVLTGGVGLLVGALTLIDADVWSSPVFWINLPVLLLGVGMKLWRLVITEPVNLAHAEIKAFQLSEQNMVRPSDLPHSQQQAELLRAATHGPETPAEELLRAGQESDQDG